MAIDLFYFLKCFSNLFDFVLAYLKLDINIYCILFTIGFDYNRQCPKTLPYILQSLLPLCSVD